MNLLCTCSLGNHRGAQACTDCVLPDLHHSPPELLGKRNFLSGDSWETDSAAQGKGQVAVEASHSGRQTTGVRRQRTDLCSEVAGCTSRGARAPALGFRSIARLGHKEVDFRAMPVVFLDPSLK